MKLEVRTTETIMINSGCGKLYMTFAESEIFINNGKSGGCCHSFTEALSRVINIALESGAEYNKVMKALSGLRCPSPFSTGKEDILSCADAISKGIKIHIDERNKTIA